MAAISNLAPTDITVDTVSEDLSYPIVTSHPGSGSIIEIAPNNYGTSYVSSSDIYTYNKKYSFSKDIVFNLPKFVSDLINKVVCDYSILDFVSYSFIPSDGIEFWLMFKAEDNDKKCSDIVIKASCRIIENYNGCNVKFEPVSYTRGVFVAKQCEIGEYVLESL